MPTIRIQGDLVLQSDTGEVKLMNEEDRLILYVSDWSTMDFLMTNYANRLKKLIPKKNRFIDQTVVLRVKDKDVLSWTGTFPKPIHFKSYFRLLRSFLQH